MLAISLGAEGAAVVALVLVVVYSRVGIKVNSFRVFGNSLGAIEGICRVVDFVYESAYVPKKIIIIILCYWQCSM